MSAPMPKISDLVDISETHGEMIPRAGIDYYTAKGYSFLGLTQNYHTSYPIKEYLKLFGTRHYCRPEDVPPQKETYPKYYECSEKETFAFRKRISEDWYCVVKYDGKETINFPWSTRFPIKDIVITEEEAMSRIKTVKEIKLEVGKTYLTKGGYIIPIVRESNNCYLSTIECSPGVSRDSKRTIQQFLSDCGRLDEDKKFGWMWEKNGSIILDPEWADKLQIVSELPFSLPPAPEGYKYAGGFPQFRNAKKGERFLSAGTIKNGLPDSQYSKSNNIICCNNGDLVDSPRLILEQIQVVVSPPAPPKPSIEVKPNNYYLTEGGYIVALDACFNSLWEMPGSVLGGLNTCKWEKDGSIEGIDSKWVSVLKIKEILQVEFPKKLPAGYQWKDGVPQFRQPKNGEEYWGGGKINYVGTAFGDHTSASVSWFILEKTKDAAVKPNVPILTEEYEFTSNPPEYRTPKFGEWYFSQKYCLSVKAESKYIDVPESHRFIVRQKKKVATPLVEKALIIPEQDTALIRNGNTLKISSPPEKPLSLLSYWVTEPAHNTYTAAKKSVRYIVLWGVISGIGYIAYNPAGVARFVKSCLPKITVRYEDVERSKI